MGRPSRTRTVGRGSGCLLIRSHSLMSHGFLSWACWPVRCVLGRRSDNIALLIRRELLRREGWVADLRQWAVPSSVSFKCRGSRALRRLLWLGTPLGRCWSMKPSRLVRLGMDVLRDRSGHIALIGDAVGALSVLQKLKARLDVDICRI